MHDFRPLAEILGYQLHGDELYKRGRGPPRAAEGLRLKQLLQNFSNGQVEVVDVPAPMPRSGQVLVKSRFSLVSIGTERMLIEFGRASWLNKAKSQPDKVKQVFEKIRTDGLAPTLEAVRSKLEQPVPLGYSNAGVVVAVGAGVTELAVGDRVVSSGPHAELVSVPKNLCAKIPDNVSDLDAAFTVVAAVGLQGVRLAEPAIGEVFGVVGLGLIGLITAQILRAGGVRVIGVDPDPARCELARRFGAESIVLSGTEDPLDALMAMTRGRGLDGVLITASTSSEEPVSLAAKASRPRGRVVLVGTAGLQFQRKDFYDRELKFQVSCSYGPGRYDENYEGKGVDYPFGLVRWTAQRNFEAVLDMMSRQTLRTEELRSRVVDFTAARDAYSDESLRRSLGLILRYESADSVAEVRRVTMNPTSSLNVSTRACTVGMVGAGSYAGQVFAKNLKLAGARLKSVSAPSGLSAAMLARKYGFEEAASDSHLLLDDSEIDTIAIATRHDLHAPFAENALKAGKHVFVEKPVAVTPQQLASLIETRRASPTPVLMVGFNRRFAPLVVQMKQLLDSVPAEPRHIAITVNAGELPADHWNRDLSVGGGRLVSEGCHFVDLARHLAGAAIVDGSAVAIDDPKRKGPADSCSIVLKFENGSTASILYLANGSKKFPKERIEAFVAGRVLQLDNFRSLKGFGWKSFRKTFSFWKQDKGHEAAMRAFFAAVSGCAPTPIPFSELVEVATWTFRLSEDIGISYSSGDAPALSPATPSITTNLEARV